jgi:hypothetical protein
MFISMSFKCAKCSPVVCLICYYCGRFVSCFCSARMQFKYFTYSSVLNINYARSEILVSCLAYNDQLLLLNKLLIFVSKAYYRESYTGIPIIEHSSVVTVAKWLDGSFDSQSRLWKAQQWFDTRKSQNMYITFLSQKQLKVKRHIVYDFVEKF